MQMSLVRKTRTACRLDDDYTITLTYDSMNSKFRHRSRLLPGELLAEISNPLSALALSVPARCPLSNTGNRTLQDARLTAKDAREGDSLDEVFDQSHTRRAGARFKNGRSQRAHLPDFDIRARGHRQE